MRRTTPRILIPFVLLVFLAGCAGTGETLAKKLAVSALQSLTLAETTYVAACKAAPSLAMCNDPLKQKIKDADLKADKAVRAALDNTALAGAAIEAVAAFTDLAK